jgi:DNA invertase Pin-like site-specific DNA recombinase
MKIAAYCRVSTDSDEQLDSLKHQKEFFTEYAEKNGHKLVRLYADEGISGTSLKKRVEFQRLLQDAKLGLFEMVVVKDISRFARNTVDFLQSIRTLKALGINTLFLTANMESLGESEFILTVFSALAQEESINLSKRVKFGKKINAQKGRVPQRIFGYDRIDKFTLAINPKEAEVVREIYRLYLDEGLGCWRLSQELNRLGYKTKFGCEWNPRGVRRVLLNPIYCGEYINNKYEIKDCLEGKQVHVPKDQHFHHDRPEWAIVSKEVFQLTQILLSQRREIHSSGEAAYTEGRNSTRHIFSSLIKCAHCGRSFYQKHYTYVNTRIYWKCQTNDQYTAKKCDNNVTITESDLINQIREYLASIIQNKEAFIQSILSEIEKERFLPKSTSAEDVQKRIRQLQSKKDKYQEMYAADVMTMSELKEKTLIVNKEIDRLSEQLDQLKLSANIDKTNIEQINSYIKEIEDFLSLESITNIEMKKIISQIVVNRDGEIKIHLRNLSDLIVN